VREEAGGTSLEAVAESCSGLSGAIVEVDVDTKEVADAERLATLTIV
jgi:hypothetical protein